MKIRQGFVSNSSSSSFILSIALIEDQTKFDKWCERLYININDCGYEYQIMDHKRIEQAIIKFNKGKLNNQWYEEDIMFDGNSFFAVATNEEYRVELAYKDYITFHNNIPEPEYAKNLLLGRGSCSIFIVNILNDEGDSSFYNNETEELEYDIDLHWFSSAQQRLYNGLSDKDNGLKFVHKRYGAARNG